jgi:hypothetical protein
LRIFAMSSLVRPSWFGGSGNKKGAIPREIALFRERLHSLWNSSGLRTCNPISL